MWQTRSSWLIAVSIWSSIRQATAKSSTVSALRSTSTPSTVKLNTSRVVEKLVWRSPRKRARPSSVDISSARRSTG
ncbi:hypothetical protein [Frankia sp. Allo2]|uniref:hypothetical protein n=1 Tax=Frankia sp. Allo2 TaxID=981405 RepID=UPI0005545938|nr:hypothetical protein [Frankia sp. Allo2]